MAKVKSGSGSRSASKSASKSKGKGSKKGPKKVAKTKSKTKKLNYNKETNSSTGSKYKINRKPENKGKSRYLEGNYRFGSTSYRNNEGTRSRTRIADQERACSKNRSRLHCSFDPNCTWANGVCKRPRGADKYRRAFAGPQGDWSMNRLPKNEDEDYRPPMGGRRGDMTGGFFKRFF